MQFSRKTDAQAIDLIVAEIRDAELIRGSLNVYNLLLIVNYVISKLQRSIKALS